jgi:tetratricopeptide (TPR) repeat protein
LILRCLAKKAADRPQRADDLIPHLDSLLTPTVGMTPTATQPVQAVDYDARAREAHPVRVAALFLLASVGVLAIVYGLVQAIGLPDWVFYGAIGLLALGFPVMLYTSHHERQRAVARTTGLHVTTPVGLKRHFTRRKAMLGGGLAFAGLGIVVALFMASRALGVGPGATLLSAGVLGEQDRLLLADFDAQGADSALGETVTELTRIALAQSAAVTILESRQVSDVLTRMRRDPLSRITPELATEIAAREGIKAYLAGEIRPVGSGYVLSARLVEAATGQALVTVRQTAANDDEIIRAVDKLAAGVRGKIGESLRSVRADPPLERETTASLAALRLYAQATRVADQGDYDRAIALLEQAVAEDSAFAMALRRIGAYYRNRGDPRSIALARQAMNRAYALRDRLSDRERYHVEAFQARMEEDYERALTSYLAILEKHPLDATALNNAGAMLGALDRAPDALPYFRRAIEADVAPMLTYTNLIGNVLWMGGVAEAESTLGVMTERMPDSPEIARMRSDIALARHDFPAADSAIRPLLSGVPSRQELAHWRLAELAWVGGRLDEAGRSSREAVDIWARRTSASDDERRLRTEMANLEREVLVPADPQGLIRRLDALWADSRRITAGRPAIQRNYLAFAMMYAHAGAGARGRQVLEEYRGALDARERSRISTRGDLALIDGMVALAENRVEDAFARLNEGCALWRSQYGVCDAGANPYLAEAYDRAGNADSALAIYERFTTLQVRNNASEWARVAPISRRLGELYEARGDAAKAIQHYGRFVELWRDADARLQPMVRDARERIARLSRDAG